MKTRSTILRETFCLFLPIMTGGMYSSVSGGSEDAVSGEYNWTAGDNYFADE